MWKNIVEPGRPQMTVWPMRIACLVLKITNYMQNVMRIAFPRQRWLHERASVLTFIRALPIW